MFDHYDDVPLPVGRGLARALWLREQSRDRSRRPEQVFNARRAVGAVSPVSEVRADAVKAAWAPLLSGQEVPLWWEDRL